MPTGKCESGPCIGRVLTNDLGLVQLFRSAKVQMINDPMDDLIVDPEFIGLYFYEHGHWVWYTEDEIAGLMLSVRSRELQLKEALRSRSRN